MRRDSVREPAGMANEAISPRLAYFARRMASFASYSRALFGQNENCRRGPERPGEVGQRLLNVSIRVNANERKTKPRKALVRAFDRAYINGKFCHTPWNPGR